ncbi:AraC family transcriptional regulator [Muricauda sp. JGD-17]|uniref:AraC family transcriptional regulator n=1 Tax=Flagellimonas ochracea TaxID=2696472 RepID=A0A964WYC0_9FLAO|nr:AraC family transcriptional regulator [Allomuricauda ochracea]NAY93071.1 AraC family transcriptional regulator [Allomuricauda ochracea]
MEVEIKKGEINSFTGKKVDGKVLFSNLTEFRAHSLTENYSLKLVFHGAEQYIVNGQKKTVGQNQFLLVPPGQELETRIKANESVKGVCAYFSKEAFEEQLDRYQTEFPIVPIFPISTSYLAVPDVFSCPSNKMQWSDPDVFLENVFGRLIPYLTHSSSKLPQLDAKKKETQCHLWEKMEKGRMFIEKNYNSKLSLEQIAKAACLSPFHFQKKFKSFYGQSPSKYLTKVRMQHAEQMLLNGHDATYTALHCGFSDAHYLKKCLKKRSIE